MKAASCEQLGSIALEGLIAENMGSKNAAIGKGRIMMLVVEVVSRFLEVED